MNGWLVGIASSLYIFNWGHWQASWGNSERSANEEFWRTLFPWFIWAPGLNTIRGFDETGRTSVGGVIHSITFYLCNWIKHDIPLRGITSGDITFRRETVIRMWKCCLRLTLSPSLIFVSTSVLRIITYIYIRNTCCTDWKRIPTRIYEGLKISSLSSMKVLHL